MHCEPYPVSARSKKKENKGFLIAHFFWAQLNISLGLDREGYKWVSHPENDNYFACSPTNALHPESSLMAPLRSLSNGR